MPAHIHADSMIQYGYDALTTDRPWELWEVMPVNSEWMPLYDNPAWNTATKYRRKKQKTININGFEVPEPVREPLPYGTEYYTIELCVDVLRLQYIWNNDRVDARLLKAGIIHLTPEAAELHAKALLSFTTCDTES